MLWIPFTVHLFAFALLLLNQFLFSKDHKISNDFKAYLTDVFNLADSNKDGGLSPEDLQSFVLLIRNEPMEPQQLSWYFSTFETNADVRISTGIAS